MGRDIHFVLHLAIVALVLAYNALLFGEVIPALVSAHNDGLLILAPLLGLASLGATYLAGRLLWLSFTEGDDR